MPTENVFLPKNSEIMCKAIYGVKAVLSESVFSLLVLAEIPPKYPIWQWAMLFLLSDYEMITAVCRYNLTAIYMLFSEPNPLFLSWVAEQKEGEQKQEMWKVKQVLRIKNLKLNHITQRNVWLHFTLHLNLSLSMNW